MNKICALCGSSDVITRKIAYVSLCQLCKAPHIHKEAHRYHMQAKRTEREKAPLTLTFKEWIAILNYFQWKCAYCLTKDFSLMEHIVSLSQGGGTTSDNCVPACVRCNRQKDVASAIGRNDLMPKELKERVKDELLRATRQFR